MIRCECIETSAGSLNQGRARGGRYSRGKMQADITKVTGLSRNGNNPTYSKTRNMWATGEGDLVRGIECQLL